MKVIHVVRQFLPTMGGLEESVLKLAQALQQKSGVDIRVVTLDRSFQSPSVPLLRQEQVEGLDVHRVAYAGSRRYPLAPSVLRHLSWGDLIHVHAIDFFFDYLALTKPVHRKPMVATTHGGYFHTTFARTLKRLYFGSATRLSARGYAAICATSEADAIAFRTIAPGKVTVIENGVDQAKLQGTASRSHRRTMLYFGRLSSNKQVHLLFPILSRLLQTHPDWRVIIAGAEDDVSMAQLNAAAAQSGVAEAVRFVLRPSNAELSGLAGESTYFISPSAYEGFGIAAVEAMSAGLIPILSHIPSFERFVRHAGVGLLFDPKRPEETAASIIALADGQPARLADDQHRLSQAATLYDWTGVADSYLEQYRAALAR